MVMELRILEVIVLVIYDGLIMEPKSVLNVRLIIMVLIVLFSVPVNIAIILIIIVMVVEPVIQRD